MANVQMFVKVDGAAAEDAVKIVTNTARVLDDWLQDAGHTLVTAKVAIKCQACDQLLNPSMGNLCDSCAREEALDRQMQEVKEGLLAPAPAAMQPAEAMF